MKTFKKIGVWQTAFLGDAVLTLPLLSRLRQAYPAAEIHYFVRSGLESLFAPCVQVDEVHGFAKRGDQKSLSAAFEYATGIRNQGFDLWISAHRSLRSGIIARKSRIPVRIGYNTPWFNRFIYTHRIDRKFYRLEEVERLMELVRPLGLNTEPPKPVLGLLPEAIEQADDLVHNLKPGPVLGIHPGSTWPTKCWPERYFADIIERAARSGVNVLILAGPGEEDQAARIVANAHTGGVEDRITDLSGKMSLPVLAAVINRLDAYLTNDSGPMHLAWVQDTPLVAMFGPTVRQLGFYPRGAGSTVMETGLGCRPCGLHGHKKCPKGHHECMTLLEPDQIWRELSGKLES